MASLWSHYASATGNSNTTSLPESFLYTAEKVSILYSVLFLSFGSKKTWPNWKKNWITRADFITMNKCVKTYNIAQLIYLHDLRSINSVSNALPNNFSRQNNIIEHWLMHSRQCAAAWSLNSRTLLWGPQHPPGRNQDNILQDSYISQLTITKNINSTSRSIHTTSIKPE